MKDLVAGLSFLFAAISASAQNVSSSIVTDDFILSSPKQSAQIYVPADEPKVVTIAADALSHDIQDVSGRLPQVVSNISNAERDVVIIGTVLNPFIQNLCKEYALPDIKNQWERFIIRVLNNKKHPSKKILLIAASDPRGAAFGVFTVSRLIGVSPWKWWADVTPDKKSVVSVSKDIHVDEAPAVKYRGVFINDEDWGLRPWASKTLDPKTGNIGPKTYAHVFELLLRLKANLIWPAMHPGTNAFFSYPGNIQMAKDYDIVVSSSHAEPMLRNNVGEWNEKTMGAFNYLTNRDSIDKYWESRVKESKGLEAIYSVGMRGVHDSQMEGVKKLKDAVPLLERVFSDQRNMLAQYIHKDVTKVPQAFTIYKEVLDIYDKGLKVPDDITLVWPDDNYGYIQRLNSDEEGVRPGGSGVYYHASYWGRPHDYLWLPSTHPALMTEEMMKAYNNGARKLWVLNVGDIKPQEFNIQQFLDMAFNPSPFEDSRYTQRYMLDWVTSLFGKKDAVKIQSILWRYFQFAFERKPEFMGWSQTEPTTQTNYTAYNHFYFGDEAQRRIDRYNTLENEVKDLRSHIAPPLAAAFYELVYYPVVSASYMNKKFLYRDDSYWYGKQNRLSAFAYADSSKKAYEDIIAATDYYNDSLSAGRWKYMMSMKPRDLPVFQPPLLPQVHIDSSESWGIIPEGFVRQDSALGGNRGYFYLPDFDNLNQQKFFTDIFLSKRSIVHWVAVVSDDWIRLSQNKGTLDAVNGKLQRRVWVDIDWSKFQNAKEAEGCIIFESGNRKIKVVVRAHYKRKGLSEGFIANDGIISIQAIHFTRLENKPETSWRVYEGLGYSGSVLYATAGRKFIDTALLQHNNACSEYVFYTDSFSHPSITFYALPAFAVNRNYGARYAFAIDNEPLQIVDLQTFGRSKEWKENVLRNRSAKTFSLGRLNKGMHTLKIYAVDPGIMLDEIRINADDKIKAYSNIPETYIR